MNYKQEVSSEGKSDNYFSTWTKLRKALAFSLKMYHTKSNTDVFVVLLDTNVADKLPKKKIWQIPIFIWSSNYTFKKKKYLESTAAFNDK